jgi:hypothetical protein
VTVTGRFQDEGSTKMRQRADFKALFALKPGR